MTALPDHFEGEDVIITFEKEDSKIVYNVEGKVMNWNIGGGSQPSEDVYAFGGKTFNFQKPREKFTMSFEVMINDSTFDLVQFGSATTGASLSNLTGKVISSADTTSRWRVIFWFQDAAGHKHHASTNVVVPAKTVYSIYRMILCDVKAISFDKDFASDSYMKGTLNLEFSAVDSQGYANYFEDTGIGVGTSTTATLASMTTTTGKGLKRKAKGYLSWNTTTPSWTAGTTTTKYRYSP